MQFPVDATFATWGIALVAKLSGVIIRPWRLPEALWAMLGQRRWLRSACFLITTHCRPQPRAQTSICSSPPAPTR